MKRAHITKDERMLVITGMDFNKKTRGSKDSNIAIKLEPSYLIENEEVLFAAGYQRIPQTWRGRGRGRGGRSGRGGRGGFQRNERSEKTTSEVVTIRIQTALRKSIIIHQTVIIERPVPEAEVEGL